MMRTVVISALATAWASAVGASAAGAQTTAASSKTDLCQTVSASIVQLSKTVEYLSAVHATLMAHNRELAAIAASKDTQAAALAASTIAYNTAEDQQNAKAAQEDLGVSTELDNEAKRLCH